MSYPTTPESVLSKIPGWEGASYRVLDGHITNRPYLVEAGGRRAVLKIDSGPRDAEFNSRIAEAHIQRTARDAGLAGDVLFVSENVLMTQYVEGVVWSLDCLEREENLDSLASALRKLHSLPLTGRTFHMRSAARAYARVIDPSRADTVNECMKKIDAGPRPHNLCFCHNDLVVENIINTPATWFLDWEYACDNDPFFDLATIAAHHKMTEEQSDYLLNAYFEGDGARWREQLRRQAEVYEALLWLWEAAQPASDPSRVTTR